MWKRSSSSVDPLLDEVRRAEHGEAVDLAAVEQLAGDERGLDGLADADVVGDEQAHRVELERHEQRHELVGARLDGDLAEAAEGPGAAPQREQERVAQEQRRVLAALLRGGRAREAWRRVTGSASSGRWMSVWSSSEPETGRTRSVSASLPDEDDPLAPAGADEAAGAELGVAAWSGAPERLRERREGLGPGRLGSSKRDRARSRGRRARPRRRARPAPKHGGDVVVAPDERALVAVRRSSGVGVRARAVRERGAAASQRGEPGDVARVGGRGAGWRVGGAPRPARPLVSARARRSRISRALSSRRSSSSWSGWL